jgi:outer membrane biosynthesis protein TonB
MATKKKTKKKPARPAKSKSASRKKPAPKKKVKPARKAKKPSPKVKQKPKQRKTAAKKKLSSKPRRVNQTARPGALRFPTQTSGSRSGEQSGDLQGLSRREAADSESVNELLEEGNAFEAGAVMGVEDAGNAEGREVHTREVPEDDVPGEYLDEE